MTEDGRVGLARVSLAAAAVAAALLGATPAGAATNNIFTSAGSTPGFSGDNGPATSAQLNTSEWVEMMPDGGYLIADQGNARIRRVAPDGTITTIAGTTVGFADGPIATAQFSGALNGIAVMPDGSILVADSNNNRVRRIANGQVTTVAGTGPAGFNGDNQAATTAQLNFPTDVAVRVDGTYLISENDNNRVRQVGLDGKITTVAGDGISGFTGDNGPATSARIAGPGGIAVTSDGGFLIAELDGNRVRKVSAGGTITRVAGTGAQSSTGDGGAAVDATLAKPFGIATRADGGFIVSEQHGQRLRAVAPDGTISRVAGTGSAGYNGDGQPAVDAQLNMPSGVAVDGEGDYLIADALNHRVRRIDAGDPPPQGQPPGPPPPPPPAPAPKEHTLLGQITYEPAYGIGFEGLDVLGPFDARPTPFSVTVTLRAPGGAELAKRSFPRFEGKARGPVLYRFDDLGPCDGCSLVLTAADVVQDTRVQDTRTVSFGGEAGQTEENLVFGRATEGGVVRGTVNVPYGARTRDLNVVILGAGGRLLANGASGPNCSARLEGAGCGSGPSPDYRLTGLPLAAVPAKVVLMQSTTSGKRVEADSADIVLDESGTTLAPTLTAVPDLPQKTTKRTVFGQINYRAPFAPGARRATDLYVPREDAAHLTVELRASNGRVLSDTTGFTRTPLGYTGFQISGLQPCADCTLVLVEGKKVVDRAPVVVPEATGSLVRRDFNYARAGKPEFVSGAVLAGDAGARGLRVVVTDAATGEKLAGTDEGQQACAGGLRCPSGETMLYRIADVPPDRDVILTLERKGTPVDTHRVHTAPANEITQAPLLVVPRGKGPRSIQGTVTNGGPFPPGDEPRDPPRGTNLVARLLGRDGSELARGPARAALERGEEVSYFLDKLPECMGCTVELLRADGVVEDRAVVDVRSDSPSVTVADLSWQAISGGAYVQGQIVLRQGSIPVDELAVHVVGSDGRVLADSTKVNGAMKAGAGLKARGRKSHSYRLGGIPRDVDKVKVVVLRRFKKKTLASTTVTLAVGGADTKVPDLKVDIDTGKG